MTDHNSKPMNKEELEKYIEKDFLPSLLSKLPIMSKHDNDTCPHLVRASLLEAENARLKAEVGELADALKLASEVGIKVADEVTRLKAEVERLRASSFVTAVPVEQYERVVKAGDAMASSIQFNEEMAQDYNGPTIVHQCVQRWNAAKEGKPSV